MCLWIPIISVIDGRICRELGWLQYPALEQCCGDNVWYKIGTTCHILLYTKDVVYVHNHAYFGKAEWDEHYNKMFNNDKEKIKDDWQIYMHWLKYEYWDDCLKIKRLLEDNDARYRLRTKVAT